MVKKGRAKQFKNKQIKNKNIQRKKSASINDPGFRELLPLKSYTKNCDEALKFLEKLADHKGILKVMKEYNWIVPKLIEIDYKGKHQDKLGYNVNFGQLIALRLRKSDHEFLSFESVLSTLCHELAHNKIGPHNEKFHRLNRELQMKVEKYALEPDDVNWNNIGKGRKLGGNKNGTKGANDRTLMYNAYMSRNGWKYTKNGHKVGGNQINKNLTQREILYKAVQIRLTKEEQVQIDLCGTTHINLSNDISNTSSTSTLLLVLLLALLLLLFKKIKKIKKYLKLLKE